MWGAFRHFLMKIGVIISRQFSQSGISLFLAALAALYLTLVMVSQWVTQWVSATFEFWQKDKKNKNNKNNKRKQKDKKRVWYCYVGIVSHSCNCRKKNTFEWWKLVSDMIVPGFVWYFALESVFVSVAEMSTFAVWAQCIARGQLIELLLELQSEFWPEHR